MSLSIEYSARTISWSMEEKTGYLSKQGFLVVLSQIMIYQRVCSKSNTTGIPRVAGTTDPSVAPETWVQPTPLLLLVAYMLLNLVFCVVFCRLLFVLLSFFLLAIVLSVLYLQILITSLVASNFSLLNLMHLTIWNWRQFHFVRTANCKNNRFFSKFDWNCKSIVMYSYVS